jgi:hypothetical protein
LDARVRSNVDTAVGDGRVGEGGGSDSHESKPQIPKLTIGIWSLGWDLGRGRSSANREDETEIDPVP